jgi:hypothetical protein
LSGIAHNKVAEIDDASPLDEASLESLKGIAVLTRMANASSEIGLNLLRANKEAMQGEDEPPAPTSVVFLAQDARRHDDD